MDFIENERNERTGPNPDESTEIQLSDFLRESPTHEASTFIVGSFAVLQKKGDDAMYRITDPLNVPLPAQIEQAWLEGNDSLVRRLMDVGPDNLK